MFGQLLHDLGEVDRREKVAPREFCQHINVLLAPQPIREYSGSRNGAPGLAEHMIISVR